MTLFPEADQDKRTETGNDNKRQIPRRNNDYSKLEVLSRIEQATAAPTELKLILRDNNISLEPKVNLYMRSLIIAIFLCAWESFNLTAMFK